jgi:N-acetyltransferase
MPFELQPHLEGSLIEVRPLRPEDWSALFAVASDPLIWEQHPSRDRFKEPVFKTFFREGLECGGAFAVLDRTTREVIGSSRFYGYDPGRSEIEIGWTFLARRYWGGRYNRELKTLMLDHAFRFVDTVVFYVGERNVRSQKALEKIGGIRDGIVQRPGSSGLEMNIRYVIHKPRIRHAAVSDAPEIFRIMRESFREYKDTLKPSSGALSESVENVSNLIVQGGALLAYDGDRAVGTVRYKQSNGTMWMSRLSVAPEYRGRRIAGSMVRTLEELARSLGCAEVRLDVRASLPANIRFYENLGYRAVGSYPHPRGPDFVITMSKPIPGR